MSKQQKEFLELYPDGYAIRAYQKENENRRCAVIAAKFINIGQNGFDYVVIDEFDFSYSVPPKFMIEVLQESSCSTASLIFVSCISTFDVQKGVYLLYHASRSVVRLALQSQKALELLITRLEGVSHNKQLRESLDRTGEIFEEIKEKNIKNAVAYTGGSIYKYPNWDERDKI